MNLMDLRERLGPYWAAYQEERARGRIIQDPDYVPPWFLIKLARARLAAARVALEQLGANADSHFGRDLAEVWTALRTIESFIEFGAHSDPIGAREQVLAGLLGAQEVETARERRLGLSADGHSRRSER